MTTPQPHVHADKIIQLANDPTLKTWSRHKNGNTDKWHQWKGDMFPNFHPDYDWHVGHEPPQEPEVMELTFKGNAPWRVPPARGECYFYIDIDGNVVVDNWYATTDDLAIFESGFCWKTEADAIAYLDAYRAAALGEGRP